MATGCSRSSSSSCCYSCCVSRPSPPPPPCPLYTFGDLLDCLAGTGNVWVQNPCNFSIWIVNKKVWEPRISTFVSLFHVRTGWQLHICARLSSSMLFTAHARRCSTRVCTPLHQQDVVKVGIKIYQRVSSLGTAHLRDTTKMHTGN